MKRVQLLTYIKNEHHLDRGGGGGAVWISIEFSQLQVGSEGAYSDRSIWVIVLAGTRYGLLWRYVFPCLPSQVEVSDNYSQKATLGEVACHVIGKKYTSEHGYS